MIDVHPATKWRPAHPATKWRHVVAMGVSPWKRNPHRTNSPEGTTGNPTRSTHVAPPGLRAGFDLRFHGFAPVATTCRPSGTNVLAPGRYVGVEEVEDDGVLFDSKPKRGLPRELATQFHESEKLQSAIRARLQKLGFALPEVGE